MSPEERIMKDLCDKDDIKEEENDIAIKKQIEVEGFLTKLKPYTKPMINAYIGIFVSLI